MLGKIQRQMLSYFITMVSAVQWPAVKTVGVEQSVTFGEVRLDYVRLGLVKLCYVMLCYVLLGYVMLG